uniref:Uncharacterized protein n=1 Tax=Chromera velia CCMP2878 TaxID=1169474 RepID=A0A0G4GXI1_9ALVE|eukprot:Cvel_23739.t1-p1 / transcript=Cvel_23739.t1 / gene=Cvel_23739 / organism=Chromera_velia_CCMP2878 / gene_product=hypothetical protein / transcript_product=hypothetical protein / location=Cvel_scaffold2484:4928-5254(-) / protein_length=109 / sequence_SO=supercontig / SO=protein_coding / is_pseudo=false
MAVRDHYTTSFEVAMWGLLMGETVVMHTPLFDNSVELLPWAGEGASITHLLFNPPNPPVRNAPHYDHLKRVVKADRDAERAFFAETSRRGGLTDWLRYFPSTVLTVQHV